MDWTGALLLIALGAIPFAAPFLLNRLFGSREATQEHETGEYPHRFYGPHVLSSGGDGGRDAGADGGGGDGGGGGD